MKQSKWQWFKNNWRWIVLIWFNAIATILSIAMSWLIEWGVGLILYLSFLLSGVIILRWQTDTPNEEYAKAIIRLTNEAIFKNEMGCCCKYCGSENVHLHHYPFDPRFHYFHCIVTRARQSVDPSAIVLAPETTYEENHETI